MTTIGWFESSRDALADLFALADHSPAAVRNSRDRGRVLVAREGSTVVGHLQLLAGDRDEEAEAKVARHTDELDAIVGSTASTTDQRLVP